MIFSGLLMYGATQRNKIIGLGLFAVLCVYLFVGSMSLTFFAVNIAIIFILSAILKKINCHALSGASILIYSVVIDIVCFYFFPVFPINVSLGAYILAGLLFNLRSAIPAIALGLMVQVIVTVQKKLAKKQQGSLMPAKIFTSQTTVKLKPLRQMI